MKQGISEINWVNKRWVLIGTSILFTLLSINQFLKAPSPERSLRNRIDELGGASVFILPDEDELDQIPSDSQNPLNPIKVALGKLLFHENALGTKPFLIDGPLKRTYSCASCHHVASGFQTGARQAIADGGAGFGNRGERRFKHPDYREREMDVQMRKAPTVLNSAYQRLMFWDGQFGAWDKNVGTEAEWKEGTPMFVNRLGFDGVESQAIAGMDVHRMAMGKGFVDEYPQYRLLFDLAFQEVQDFPTYSDQNVALAIAAYERTLLSNQAPFQKWLRGKSGALSRREKKGALLFFGKAGCNNCHSGPALSGEGFHALGMGELKGDDTYRTKGIKNERLGRGGFTKKKEDMYKFKTPQLYNLADASFFGHGATFKSIREVIEYINRAVPQSEEIHEDQLSPLFKPLGLTSEEIELLDLFVNKSLYDKHLQRYVPQNVPSGLPFPVADSASLPESRLHGMK